MGETIGKGAIARKERRERDRETEGGLKETESERDRQRPTARSANAMFGKQVDQLG